LKRVPLNADLLYEPGTFLAWCRYEEQLSVRSRFESLLRQFDRASDQSRGGEDHEPEVTVPVANDLLWWDTVVSRKLELEPDSFPPEASVDDVPLAAAEPFVSASSVPKRRGRRPQGLIECQELFSECRIDRSDRVLDILENIVADSIFLLTIGAV
jgi:hypothetical protein